jgi:hypothetical protein
MTDTCVLLVLEAESPRSAASAVGFLVRPPFLNCRHRLLDVFSYGRAQRELWFLFPFLEGHCSHHGCPTLMILSNLRISQRFHLQKSHIERLGFHCRFGGAQMISLQQPVSTTIQLILPMLWVFSFKEVLVK